MENTPPPGIGRFFMLGAMSSIFANRPVYHIACQDIGKAAATALLSPTENAGKTINLVGQIATVDEMHSSLDRAEGCSSWRMWFPRWFILAVTPYHYRQMFIVRDLYLYQPFFYHLSRLMIASGWLIHTKKEKCLVL